MVNKEEIQADFESILIHSQDYPFGLNGTKAIIDEWYEAKKQFIELFNGNTMWRSKRTIKVELSKEQRSRKFNDFILALDEEGVLTEDFETFLRCNTEGFFENKVTLPYPKYNINLGSKLSKTFKKFLPSQEITRWAQDTASQYIQENKIEGYLYLSVDPRDFLTLSENNENWWSCQSLDGDYRAGNLSYMVDSTTLVAYLADGNMKHLKCLPQEMKWNSKKWRMLVHTDLKNSIYYNRQYPFTSNTLMEVTYMQLQNLLKDNFFDEPRNYGFKVISQGKEDILLPINQITLGGRIFSMNDIIDTSDYLGYSDLECSSSYTPIISLSSKHRNYKTKYSLGFNATSYDEELKETRSIIGFKIGDKPICPCCGKTPLEKDDSFLCYGCIAEYDADEDFFLKCDGCYHRIYEDDEVHFINDIAYCKNCYNEMQIEEEDDV